MNDPSISRALVIAAVTLLLAMFAGYKLGGGKDGERFQVVKHEAVDEVVSDEPLMKTATKARPEETKKEWSEDPLGLPNEGVVHFDSDEAFRKFLATFPRDGSEIVGTIPRLRAVRVRGKLGYLEDYDVDSNFFFEIPDLPQGGGVQRGALGFGSQLLDWLGVSDRPETWGEGVRVAVIDSGVARHSTFLKEVPQIDLRSDPSGEFSGHGTAVASLIAGANPQAEGLAPGADLLSIAVTDADGVTNSFDVAQAIIRAVDEGVDFISLALGGPPSSVLNDAVAFADANGVAVVAAAGNNGQDFILAPASIESVYSVGAIEGQGYLLDFSSRGNVDINAPGLSVNAAFPGDRLIGFTGTSAAEPIALAAAVVIQSLNPENTPRQSMDAVIAAANDSGPQGPDFTYGGGEINLVAALNAGEPGLRDIGVSGVFYEPPAPGSNTGEVTTVFENRGTDAIISSEVTLSGDVANTVFALPNLAPGQTVAFSFPVDQNLINSPDGFGLETQVVTTDGTRDSSPRDNRRTFQQLPEVE